MEYRFGGAALFSDATDILAQPIEETLAVNLTGDGAVAVSVKDCAGTPSLLPEDTTYDILAWTPVSLEAVPDTGRMFVYWLEGGKAVSNENPLAFDMPAGGRTLTAVFAEPHTLTVNINGLNATGANLNRVAVRVLDGTTGGTESGGVGLTEAEREEDDEPYVYTIPDGFDIELSPLRGSEEQWFFYRWYGAEISGSNKCTNLLVFEAVDDVEYTARFRDGRHSADYQQLSEERPYVVSEAETLHVIALYNAGVYSCDNTIAGYDDDEGGTNCPPHDADYSPQDWSINLSELLRVIQFYNIGLLLGDDGQSYTFTWDACEEGDGYCAGLANPVTEPTCDTGGFPY